MEKGEKIKLDEKVKIVGTGASKFMPKGAIYEVHPRHARKLVDAGKATCHGGLPKFDK